MKKKTYFSRENNKLHVNVFHSENKQKKKDPCLTKLLPPPLEVEVLLQYVKELHHLGEDEDAVPLLPEPGEQLVQQHQLPGPVDQLLQPLLLNTSQSANN